jgi:hypothetical protein
MPRSFLALRSARARHGLKVEAETSRRLPSELRVGRVSRWPNWACHDAEWTASLRGCFSSRILTEELLVVLSQPFAHERHMLAPEARAPALEPKNREAKSSIRFALSVMASLPQIEGGRHL